MTAILDKLNLYTEFLIEYDNDALVVYISGLDKDGFWFDLLIEDGVNDPESFAQGYQTALKERGYFSTITKVIYD